MNIPNYAIIKELGKGGMATVYLAEQLMLSRKVALKVLNKDMASDETFRKSFLAEGKIIANLEHPNIVRVYDVGVTEDAILFMAMEYFSEGTLKERIEAGKLEPKEAIRILSEVGSGLAHAHAQGFIHRDIKPGNVLFHASGRAVLSDFGIAKLQDTAGDLTQMGYVQGTLHYMSPEQATTTVLDQRSDIYSLGLVFYEMLTGEKAFKSDTTVQAIYQHTTAPPPHLPFELAQYQPVLNKALAKNPDERFSTVDEYIQAVENPSVVSEDKTIVYIGDRKPAGEETIHAIPENSGHFTQTSREIVKSDAGNGKKSWLVAAIAASVIAAAGAGGFMKYQGVVEEKNGLAAEAKKKADDEAMAKTAAEEKARAEAEEQRKAEEAEKQRLAKEELKKQRLAEEARQRELEEAAKQKEEARKLAAADEKKRQEKAAKQAREQQLAERARLQKAKEDALRAQRQREWQAAQQRAAQARAQQARNQPAQRKQQPPKQTQQPQSGRNEAADAFAEEAARKAGGHFGDFVGGKLFK